MIYKQLGRVLILLVVSTKTANGYSTLRGSSMNTAMAPHPALTSMVGTWEAKDGVSTTIMGPFSVADGKWLSVTKPDDDGNIYLRHDSMDQLMYVQNDKMQYCFNYQAPEGEGSETHHFKSCLQVIMIMTQVQWLISVGEAHVFPLTKLTAQVVNVHIGSFNLMPMAR